LAARRRQHVTDGFWNKLFFPNHSWEQKDNLSPQELRAKLDEFHKYRVNERIIPLYRSAAAARALGIASVGALLLVLAWAVRPWRRPPDFDAEFAKALTAMLLVSPITWNHYDVMLLLPLAVLWSRLFGWKRVVFRVAVVSLFINFPFLQNLTIPGSANEAVAYPVHTVTTLSYHTYVLLTFFVLLLLELRRVPAGQPALAPASSSAIRLRSSSGIGALAPRS
jgi:hypothetical protein